MSRSVLVVDDDASVARLVGAVLAREGVATELAHDGPAALARLQRGGIELVLTDMTMPGMSGLELVRAAEARGLRTPFLLMSAFLDPETERTLFAEPAIAGVLRKPFEIARLLADVQAILAATARTDAQAAPSGPLAPAADAPGATASARFAAGAADGSCREASPDAPCLTLALVPSWYFQPWPPPPGTLMPCAVASARGAAAATVSVAPAGPAAAPPLAPC